MLRTFIFTTLLLAGFAASAHDFYLMPDTFFPKRGSMLQFHLYVGDEFKQEEERPVQYYINKTYQWITGSGSQNFLRRYPDSTMPVFSEQVDFSGQGLLAITRDYARIRLAPAKFASYLQEEGLDEILKQRAAFSSKDSVREKYTRHLKSLVASDDGKGKLYKKVLGHTLELILLQNPYTKQTGDELEAQVLFRGKPLPGAALEAICKDANGEIHRTVLKSDRSGNIKFRLVQRGAWIVRITHMIPVTGDADYESFWASYTFGIR